MILLTIRLGKALAGRTAYNDVNSAQFLIKLGKIISYYIVNEHKTRHMICNISLIRCLCVLIKFCSRNKLELPSLKETIAESTSTSE